MKQGWEIKKLGEVCETAKNIKWANIPASLNISYIDLSAVDRDSSSITETQLINSSNAPSRAKQIVRYGDVIFATTRPTLRRLCAIPEDYDNAICSTGFCVLRPKKEILTEWIFYTLKCDAYYAYIEPIQKGASYPAVTDNEVKEYTFLMPSLAEQRRIVEILDREFERIDALKANAEQNLQHAKDLFQAALKQELQPKEGWEPKTIRELSEELFAGGDVPKHALSKTITTEYNVPIYANAVEQDGLYGYTNVARVNKPSITIAGRGSGTGYIIERTEKYLPVVRLIVIVPQTQIVRNRFLYYALKSLDIKSNGSAIPQLTVPMIAQYIVNYPTLTAQDVIIGVLDELNERCKALEDNYKKTIALCDDMKQALLRKAFNGEL